MSFSLDRTAPCPSCGGQLTFKFAGARAVVCKYCKALVARTDRSLATIGRVADLIDIPSPLTLHAMGRWGQKRFEIEGRVQLDRAGAPGAPWQEFFVGFPETGEWSWVAYAQGRWYATREIKPMPPVPPAGQLRPGMPLQLAGYPPLVVAEVGRRRVVSAEGELPNVAQPGVPTFYADVSGPNGVFGTIDYGDGQTIAPTLYMGGAFDPAQLKLDSGQPLEAPQAQTAECTCPNCGGNLPIVAPGTTERIVCKYCGAISDVRQGALSVLGQAPKPAYNPYVPIGQEGTLRNQRVVCIGFVVRGTNVDGSRYQWREYLLFAGPSVGYLWLMEEDGRWQLVTPLAPGDVQVGNSGAIYRGQSYSFKQRVMAQVDCVIGEFYWKVEVGEEVEATEYQGPGGIVSVERDQNEMQTSFCAPIEAREIGQAFNLSPPPSPAMFSGGDSGEGGGKGCSTAVTIVIVIVIILILMSLGDCDGGGGGVYIGPSFGGK